jgi:hypothetical protein
MEGGIAILLLLIIVAVAGVIAIGMYLTGGAMRFGKSDVDEPDPDAASGADGGQRPTHVTPRDPVQEHTHFVGVPRDETDDQHR